MAGKEIKEEDEKEGGQSLAGKGEKKQIKGKEKQQQS